MNRVLRILVAAVAVAASTLVAVEADAAPPQRAPMSDRWCC